MQTATSMAPLRMCGLGWRSAHQIFLTHYGSHVSRSYATPTQETDYVGVSEAAGLPAQAECHDHRFVGNVLVPLAGTRNPGTLATPVSSTRVIREAWAWALVTGATSAG